MVEVEQLAPNPKKSNPFLYDLYRQGVSISDDVIVMWGINNNELVLVYVPTGERVRVLFSSNREEEVRVYKTEGLRRETDPIGKMMSEDDMK